MRSLVSLTLLVCLGAGPCPLARAAGAVADPSSAPADATLSVFVFRDGRPLAGAAIHVGNSVSLETGELGVEARVPSGRHRLVVEVAGEDPVELDLLLAPEEDVEILVTLPDGGRPAQVLVESSGSRPVVEAVEAAAGTAVDVERLVGKLAGRITSAEDGRPIAGARLFASGRAESVVTDGEGRYALELPAGTYALSVVHADFSTRTVPDVRVIPAEQVRADLELTPSGVELAEYVVSAPYIQGSVAAIVAEVRANAVVAEVLGAEQMAASGDGDAADALGRATGITVEDGKYVQVRGLDPRYATSQLNALELPSPDPNRRVVPLDLFPVGVLESIEVKKTYSPDLPGSFGGGLVRLSTKGVPEEGFARISASIGFDTEATFRDGLGYEGGDLDLLGIDDGTRDLPAAIERATAGGTRPLAVRSLTNPDGFTAAELEALGESFRNIYAIEDETLPPGFSLGLSMGDRALTSIGQVGFAFSTIYASDYEHHVGPENSIATSGSGLVLQDQFRETETEHGVTLGGLLTLGAELGDYHRVTSNTFLIRKTDDTARLQEGLRSENDQQVRDHLLELVERQLLLQQLETHHVFPTLGDIALTLRGQIGRGERTSPDRREYSYVQTRDVFVLENSSLGRRFDDLDDDILGYGADLSLPLASEGPLAAGGPFATVLSAGVQRDERDRRSDVQRFQFVYAGGDIPFAIRSQVNPELIFTPENIGPDGFVLDDLTGANDDYRGTQEVLGVYGMVDTTLFDSVRLVGGARFEEAELSVRTFQSAAGGGEAAVESGLDTSDVLPGITATWYLPWDLQLRVAYSETLARPELNELSATTFIDPETNDTFLGNPDLEQTEILNLDARLEWFPSERESVTLGAFYKDFTDPIEVVRIPGFNAPRSFQNAERAESFGVELGFLTRLDRWSGGLVAPGSPVGRLLERMSLEGNVTWIDSTVDLGEGNFTNTTTNRALQGQAPYVVNVKLRFEDEDLGTKGSLLFNILGERIAEVGIQGLPDVKEESVPRLDLLVEQVLSESWSAKVGVKNILGSDPEFRQGDLVQRGYEAGQEIGLSVQYEFR